MNRIQHLLLSLALATAAPAFAASSASSASSEGSSASVGSSSTSIEQSSASSSPGDKKAEGPYRIIHVAEADTQTGKVRLALKAEGGTHEFFLLLPRETFAQAGLAVGRIVTAKACSSRRATRRSRSSWWWTTRGSMS
jgi:hypothetical protein